MLGGGVIIEDGVIFGGGINIWGGVIFEGGVSGKFYIDFKPSIFFSIFYLPQYNLNKISSKV